MSVDDYSPFEARLFDKSKGYCGSCSEHLEEIGQKRICLYRYSGQEGILLLWNSSKGKAL